MYIQNLASLNTDVAYYKFSSKIWPSNNQFPDSGITGATQEMYLRPRGDHALPHQKVVESEKLEGHHDITKPLSKPSELQSPLTLASQDGWYSPRSHPLLVPSSNSGMIDKPPSLR